MNSQRWKVLSTELVLDASPYMIVHKEKVELPSGTVIEDYYQYIMPDVSVVVSHTDNEILMIKQYRHGIRKFTYTLPGGQVEHNEPPIMTARRELTEETGVSGGSIMHLGSYARDLSKGGGYMHFYLVSHPDKFEEASEPDIEGGEMEWVPIGTIRQYLKTEHVGSVGIALALALSLIRIEAK